ncbi:MAG: hypothetical protein AAF483_18625 [Planctomycetota bacterium]
MQLPTSILPAKNPGDTRRLFTGELETGSCEALDDGICSWMSGVQLKLPSDPTKRNSPVVLCFATELWAASRWIVPEFLSTSV